MNYAVTGIDRNNGRREYITQETIEEEEAPETNRPFIQTPSDKMLERIDTTGNNDKHTNNVRITSGKTSSSPVESRTSSDKSLKKTSGLIQRHKTELQKEKIASGRRSQVMPMSNE